MTKGLSLSGDQYQTHDGSASPLAGEQYAAASPVQRYKRLKPPSTADVLRKQGKEMEWEQKLNDTASPDEKAVVEPDPQDT